MDVVDGGERDPDNPLSCPATQFYSLIQNQIMMQLVRALNIAAIDGVEDGRGAARLRQVSVICCCRTALT